MNTGMLARAHRPAGPSAPPRRAAPDTLQSRLVDPLGARSLVDPLEAAPVQRKRDKQTVFKEMSQHAGEDEQVDPDALPFPQPLKVSSLSASEKHYDDSFQSGLKILAALQNPPKKEEKERNIDTVDRKLRNNYHHLASAKVDVPVTKEKGDKKDEKQTDFTDLFDVDELGSEEDEGGTEEVSINPRRLADGQKVKRYDFETLRNGGQDAHYSNYFEPHSGRFIAHVNYGENDKKEAAQRGGDVVSNADIIASQLVAAQELEEGRKKEDRVPIELKELRRDGIVNAQTLNIILWCDGSEMKYLLQNYTMSSTGFESAKDASKDFVALLGSPNGRAAGWLAVHYSELLNLEPLDSIAYDEDSMTIRYGAPKYDESSDEKNSEDFFF